VREASFLLKRVFSDLSRRFLTAIPDRKKWFTRDVIISEDLPKSMFSRISAEQNFFTL